MKDKNYRPVLARVGACRFGLRSKDRKWASRADLFGWVVPELGHLTLCGEGCPHALRLGFMLHGTRHARDEFYQNGQLAILLQATGSPTFV